MPQTSLPRPLRVAVVGASGYGGAELLRHLLIHPYVQVTKLVAKDNLGKKLDQVHLSLAGLTELVIEDLTPADIAPHADLVCVGLPHKVSAAIVAEFVDLGLAVIDLSGDYRLLDAGQYEQFYEAKHPFPERLGSFVYGLPEMNREALSGARRVASPGCFATAITLGLLPFAKAGLLRGRVQVSALTGSSGSGANPAIGTHHPLRAQNLKAYKALSHQHVPEIEQNLHLSGAPDVHLEMVPVSAPLVRGILAMSWFQVDESLQAADVKSMLKKAYAGERLIRVVTDRLPEVNAVAGSMYTEVAVSIAAQAIDGKRTVVAHTAMDNLIKGGAGQAIQSLNLMLGVDEYTGLLAPSQWP